MGLEESTATISGASFTSCTAVSETERPATTHYALRQLVRPSARIRTTSSFTTIDGDCCTCAQPFELQFDPLTAITRPPPIINHFIPPTYALTLCASENAAPQSVPSRVTYPPTAANGSGVTATTIDSIICSTVLLLRCAGIGSDWNRIGWAPALRHGYVWHGCRWWACRSIVLAPLGSIVMIINQSVRYLSGLPIPPQSTPCVYEQHRMATSSACLYRPHMPPLTHWPSPIRLEHSDVELVPPLLQLVLVVLCHGRALR